MAARKGDNSICCLSVGLIIIYNTITLTLRPITRKIPQEIVIIKSRSPIISYDSQVEICN